MAHEKNAPITRREFATAAALAAAAVAGGLGSALVAARSAAADDALITDVPGNATMITALAYVNESAKAGQICSGCVLYTGPAEGRGKCALFQQGQVAAKGWCQSWAPKPKS